MAVSELQRLVSYAAADVRKSVAHADNYSLDCVISRRQYLDWDSVVTDYMLLGQK